MNLERSKSILAGFLLASLVAVMGMPASTPTPSRTGRPTATPSVAPTVSATPSTNTFKCPNVIANKLDGTYYKTSRRVAEYPFECFPKASTASLYGYKSLKQKKTSNLSGWWRLSLKSVLNTCKDNPALGSATFFFQVKQNDAGTFAEFCPGSLRMVGYRTNTGLSVSALTTLTPSNTKLVCSNDEMEGTVSVELDGIKVDADGFTRANLARYKTVYRCSDPDSEATPCSIEYIGTAKLESDHFFPAPPDNVNGLRSACTETLGNVCATCHPGIDFGGLE